MKSLNLTIEMNDVIYEVENALCNINQKKKEF